MDKIEIGEYVRTNNGIIGKFIKIERDDIDTSLKWYVFNDGKNERYINKPYIAKHSENPIDLVKVGDILEIYFPIRKTMLKIFVDEYFKDSMIFSGIIQKRINLKSILTKEMYEQNYYKVEE